MSRVHQIGSIILVTLLGACGGGSTAPQVYTSLTLASSSPLAYQYGTPTVVTLTAKDANGNPMSLGGAVPVWSIDPANVVISGSTIHVQPGATGLVTISASLTLQGVTRGSNGIDETVGLAPPSGNVAAEVSAGAYGSSNSFAPVTIDIAAGGIVHWSGLKSGTGHSVHFDAVTPFSNGTAAASGAIGSIDTVSATLATPGTYTYHCDNHVGMTGTVFVH